MSAYLFHIELTEVNDQVASLTSLQRTHIDRLLAVGHLISYSVSLSGNQIWCIVEAEDEQEALTIVADFPLRNLFKDAVCQPLKFHNSVPVSLPGVSLN